MATRRATTPPSDLPVVGPALTLVSHIGVNLIELELRDRIRRVVDETDYVLLSGVGKLILDLDKDRKSLRTAYASRRKQRLCNLSAMRTNVPKSGASLYREYTDADAAARAYLAKIAILDNATGMLAALLEAHSALLSDKGDFNAALAKIKAFSKDLAAVQAVLKKTRET